MVNWRPTSKKSSGGGAPRALEKDQTLVYVGTYTGPKSKGIYLFRLQTENLDVPQNVTLVPLGLAVETPSPSFLELDLKRRLLFAVNELNAFEGKPTGSVSAFAIDRANGTLRLINQRPSMGTGPCHLVLDKARRNLLVANYGSGSVSVIPVAADGTLGAASDVVQHTGSSVNPDRQKGPHAHCVTLDAANRFVFVCDLGLDQVLAYRFDPQRGKLTPHNPPFASLRPGAGPRHMVFRPDGRFAYVTNENGATRLVPASHRWTDAARALRGREHDGGDRRAPVGQMALRLESRPQQRRAVQRRPRQGDAHLGRGANDGRLQPASFRDRAVRQTCRDWQSEFRYDPRRAHRSRKRSTEAIGRLRERAVAYLHEVPAGGAVVMPPREVTRTPRNTRSHEIMVRRGSPQALALSLPKGVLVLS